MEIIITIIIVVVIAGIAFVFGRRLGDDGSRTLGRVVKSLNDAESRLERTKESIDNNLEKQSDRSEDVRKHIERVDDSISRSERIKAIAEELRRRYESAEN